MTQPLLVPFVCSKCNKELVWATIAANVFCPSCHIWVKPSGEVVKRIRIGSVNLSNAVYGQLSLFTTET